MLSSIQKLRFKHPSQKKVAEAIRHLFGFFPTNINLYQQAFRHASAAKEIKRGIKNSNERLEFLGDAVLGSIVAEYVFLLYPYKEEGFLTQLRSRIVNRAQLNGLAIKLGLDQLVESDLKGAKAGSIYGDALEALVGAAYLDKGYEKVKKSVIKRILTVHLNIQELEQNDTDYKSRLLNWSQKEKKKIEFILLSEKKMEDGQKEYYLQLEINGKVVSKASNTSKRRAEQLCALTAVEKLNIP